MSFLKQANKFFAEGNYQEAYNHYLEAAKVIGYPNVSFNLEMCQKRLGSDNAMQKVEAGLRRVENSMLNDYFDQIYLVNLEHKVQDRLTVANHLSQNGVKFKLFNAVNGYQGAVLEQFNEYKKKPIASLKRYAEFNHLEQRRNNHLIESAGAFGYIHTYLKILKDAKENNYSRFLILEDDILLSNHFEEKFKSFINSISDDWKVLQFGASQYGWNGFDESQSIKSGYYYPDRKEDFATCGSFAIAFDQSVVDEVIEAQQSFEAPFDHLPMSEIYKRYYKKCFVAYPNIMMPDVSESSIRGGRDQHKHGELMKWRVADFDYPLDKPSLSIIITSETNLKYFNQFTDSANQPFDLRMFFKTKDGLRPLHNKELLSYDINQNVLPLNDEAIMLESDHVATLQKEVILTEANIIGFIEYKTGVSHENKSSLESVKSEFPQIVHDRVSVIIPTYKRPKNLTNALKSVVEQDYSDIEVIVVSDNGEGSEFNQETKAIVESFLNINNKCIVKFMTHVVNRNGAAARNTGILASTGEYICFLDDDDIYLPGRLAKSIEKLKNTPKNIGAVYCGFLGWNSPENDLNRYKAGDLTLEIFLLDYKKHYLHTNTATYKRDAVLRINGFDESYKRHQDLEFNIRFFQYYKIDVVKEALVRLNPEPSDVSNKVFNIEMANLKSKFLGQFSHIVAGYDVEREIYLKHWSEVSRYVSDSSLLIETLSADYKNGFYKVLIEKVLEKK
jgi:glycosyltransferase involved in cell wall biosynthesis/GR25 family glycosyltransferase involved in LPS biosynthesis